MFALGRFVLLALIVACGSATAAWGGFADRIDPKAAVAWNEGRVGDAQQILEHYSADPEDADDVANSILLMDVRHGLATSDPADDLHLASAVVKVARASDDPELLIDALSTRSRVLFASGQKEAAAADIRDVEALAGDRPGESVALALAVRAQIELADGATEAAAATLAAAVDRLAGLDSPTWRSILVLTSSGSSFGQLGDLQLSRGNRKRALDLSVALYGEHHPAVLRPVVDYVTTLSGLGEFDLARNSLPLGFEIAEAYFGANHRLSLELLLAESKLEVLSRNYAVARDKAASTSERARQALGPADPLTLDAMSAFAQTLYETGEFPESKRVHEETIAAYRGAPSGETSLLSPILNSYGNLLERMQLFKEAGQAYDEAIALVERTTGEGAFQAGVLNLNSAPSVLRGGDTTGAHRRLEEGVRILSTFWPEEHASWATVFNIQGDVYQASGDYAAAIDAYRNALKRSSPERRMPALTNLGNLFSVLGEGSTALYEQAVALSEEHLGPSHPTTLLIRCNLADEQIRLERLDEAVVSLDILERRLDSTTEELGFLAVSVAFSRVQLARFAGRHEEAISQAQRALRLARDVVDEHVKIADIFIARAISEAALGRFDESEASLKQALTFAETQGVARSMEAAQATAFLAILALRRGASQEALEYASAGSERLRNQFQRTVGMLTERQALGFQPVRERNLGVLLALATSDQNPQIRNRAATAGWNEVVLSRAAVQKEIAERYRRLRESSNHELGSAAAGVEAARRRLAYLLIGNEDLAQKELEAALEASRREVADRESDLASAVRKVSPGQVPEYPSPERIARAIPEHSALVSFVRVARVTEALLEPDREEHYVAFVLVPSSDVPLVIDLGQANRIDELVSRWRSVAGIPPSRFASRSGDLVSVSKKLRSVVWDPVRKAVGDSKRVYLVPDDRLSFVAFAALPKEGGGYLIEDAPDIHTLNSEKDLAVFEGGGKIEPSGFLLVGNPEYGAVADEYPAIAESRGFSAECDRFDTMAFGKIPGTGEEIVAIATLAGDREVVALTGKGATEASFREHAPTAKIIHVATHGFSLGQSCARAGNGLEPGAPIGPAPEETLQGLAFTGANRLMDSRGGDGLLTSDEITRMDLSEAQWVVLSACDTGLGVAHSGEGVLGLRRAFAIAGAQTVIMSLWKVSDTETREWMKSLYRYRLAGSDTIDSVRRASLDRLAARRKAGLSDHPYYWAAFVAVGNWH